MEGYYINGKLNGWGRRGENDFTYLYGFKITQEGIYRKNIFMEYILDTSVKESDIAFVDCSFDYNTFLTNDNSLYISDSIDYPYGLRRNNPIKYCNNAKKVYKGNRSFIITNENKLYEQINKESIFIDDNVKDVNENCYLKEDGRLYYLNKETIADNVSKMSGW